MQILKAIDDKIAAEYFVFGIPRSSCCRHDTFTCSSTGAGRVASQTLRNSTSLTILPNVFHSLETFLKPGNTMDCISCISITLKKYGKVFDICLGAKPSLVVADPELLKLILNKDFPNFRDRYIFQFPGAPFNKNVFHSQGNSWKRIRNILTPTFSAGKILWWRSHVY